MAALGLSSPWDRVDELIEAGDVDAAMKSLADVKEQSPVRDVLAIKISLVTKSVPPGMAMQKLVQLMRTHAEVPGAQDLYREASRLSYTEGASSLAHSHPPPPPDADD